MAASTPISDIPANALPMIVTTSITGTERNTILSDIVYFWISGSEGLAALMVGLVQFNNLAFIEAGPDAAMFGGVNGLKVSA